jgi:biuret amidohydrolase
MEHAFGLAIPTTLEEVCDPKRVALVVYDMQVGILSQITNGEQILFGVLQVLQAARAAGIRIFFSRHMGLPKELMGVSQWRVAMQWQQVDSVEQVQPRFLRDTPPFQLVPQLSPLPGEAIFDKITMSAFEGTWLDIALRDCGVNAIVIMGVAMEVGSNQPCVTRLT